MASLVRSFKSMRYSTEENAVRDATKDDDNYQVDEDLFNQIAEYSKDSEKYPKIFQMLYKRLIDYPKINHVHKALILIDFGLDNFCSDFADDMGAQYSTIQRITKYRYYKNGDKDIASSVRARANVIIQKLSAEKEEERPTQRQAEGTAPPEPEAAAPKKRTYVMSQPTTTPTPVSEGPEEEPEEEAEPEGDFQFEGMSSGVEVYGREGSNAARVNGIYIPGDEVNGRTSYARDEIMDDPICLWFWPGKNLWMISRQSCINTDQAYACTQCQVENPVDIPATCVWRVFDKIAMQYVKDSDIMIRPSNEEEN